MSQAGSYNTGTFPPSSVVETLTSNSGGAVGPDASNNINVVGDGVTITGVGNPGTNTITFSLIGGTFLDTLTGNTGGPVGPDGTGNINIVNANTTVDIAGNAGTNTLTQDFGLSNLILGSDASGITTAARNVGLGLNALTALTSGSNNVAIGFQAGQSIQGGGRNTIVGNNAAPSLNASENTCIGDTCGFSLTTGTNNTFVGVFAGQSCSSGSHNTCIGESSGQNTTGSFNTSLGFGSNPSVTGQYNTVLGYSAGGLLSTNESSNILIGANNTGVNGWNNTLKIGSSTGSAIAQLNRAFICGIDNVNVGSVAKVVTMASDQLGTATITAGSGITVTPGANTITISSTGADLLTYTNVNTTPYVVAAGDEYLGVDCSVAPITLQFPNAPATGRVYIVKDFGGFANTNNITLTSVGGAIGFDGSLSYVMNTQFASVQLLFDGTNYQIF